MSSSSKLTPISSSGAMVEINSAAMRRLGPTHTVRRVEQLFALSAARAAYGSARTDKPSINFVNGSAPSLLRNGAGLVRHRFALGVFDLPQKRDKWRVLLRARLAFMLRGYFGTNLGLSADAERQEWIDTG